MTVVKRITVFLLCVMSALITYPSLSDSKPNSNFELTVSRNTTVVGSPIYFKPSGALTRTQINVKDKPSGSEAVIRRHTKKAFVFQPLQAGEYTIEAKLKKGTTIQKTITVNPHSKLLDKYAPHVFFHEDEIYRPTRYEAFVENARIYKRNPTVLDLMNPNPTMFDLTDYTDRERREYGGRTQKYPMFPILFLNGGEEAYPEYQKKYSPSVYASLHEGIEFRDNTYTAITYWLFYVYDPKLGRTKELTEHQSDLERVTILIGDDGPEWVAASQHYGGERREWEKTPKTGTHIHLHPALGAHSNYMTDSSKYDGDGLYGQFQHVGFMSARKIPIYSDKTGSADAISPDGSRGTEYRITPLTGNEVWSEYTGSFSSFTDIGRIPMQRMQWKNLSKWLRVKVLPDEVQRTVSASNVSLKNKKEELTVQANLHNTGVKPSTFYIILEAKPSEKSWDSAGKRFLGQKAIPLGTTVDKRVNARFQRPEELSGSWDFRVKTSLYEHKLAESEDQSQIFLKTFTF